MSHVNNKQMNSALCLDSLLGDLQMKGRGQWHCDILHFFISEAVDAAAGASKMITQSPINCRDRWGGKRKGLCCVWTCVRVWGGLSNVDPLKQLVRWGVGGLRTTEFKP